MNDQIGHNNPPSDIESRVQDLIANANRWLNERPTFDDDDIAGKAQDFIGQLNSQKKVIEKARTDFNAPLNKQVKANNEYHKGLAALVDTAKSLLQKPLTEFLTKKRQQEEAAALELIRQEEAAKETARFLAEEALSSENKVEATVAAQAAEEEAAEAEKVANQQVKAAEKPKAKGSYARAASLRKYYDTSITDHSAALEFFKNHPKVHAAVLEAAKQLVNGNPDLKNGSATIPGVKVTMTERAV